MNEIQERNSMTLLERLYYDMKLKVDYTGKMSELLKTGLEKHDTNYTSMLLVKHDVNLQNVANGEYSIFSRLRNILIELGSFQLANGFNYQSNTINSLFTIFTIGSFLGFDNIVSNYIYEYPTFTGIFLLSIGSGIDFTLINISKVFTNICCIGTYLFTGSEDALTELSNSLSDIRLSLYENNNEPQDGFFNNYYFKLKLKLKLKLMGHPITMITLGLITTVLKLF